jgi:hypothetical protein
MIGAVSIAGICLQLLACAVGYNYNDKVEEDEMDGNYSTNGARKFMGNEVTTMKTKT